MNRSPEKTQFRRVPDLVADLTAENVKLRAALEQALKYCEGEGYLQDVEREARKALGVQS